MLNYCIEKASQIPYIKGQQRHYSVVVDKRGKILGEGGNCYKTTHPLMYKTARRLGTYGSYIHSECRALIRALKNGTPHKIYVVRTNRNNEPMYSAPCIICARLIKEAGIKSIEYSVGGML